MRKIGNVLVAIVVASSLLLGLIAQPVATEPSVAKAARQRGILHK